MSKGTILIGMFFLGILAIWAINLFQNFQTANELDYYLLEETTEAAMLDAVDIAYYRSSGGQIRMDREKFLESFIRRFAENVDNTRDYYIKVIDLNETPPKVSVQVDSSTVASFNGQSGRIINKIDAIVESLNKDGHAISDISCK